MLGTYRKLFELLDARARRQFFYLLVLIAIMAIFDVVGVASFLPFLTVLANPGIVRRNPYFAHLIDRLGLAGDNQLLIFLGGLSFAFVVLSLILKVVTLYAISRFSTMRIHSIGTRLFDGYIQQPYVWFLNRHSAALGKTVLNEVDRVVGEAIIPAMRIIAQSISMVALVALLLLVNPWVAVVVAGALGGTYLLVFLLVRRLLTRAGIRRADANRRRFQIAQETMGGIKEIKIMGLEEVHSGRFRAASLRLARAANLTQFISEVPRYFLEAIAFGGMILLVIVLLLRGSGELADVLPTLGVFAVAGMRMFPGLQQIYNSLTLLRVVGPMLDNVHRDMIEVGLARRSSQPVSRVPLRLQDRLDLVGIYYRYPKAERSALKDLNLEIKANSTVGIVGGTGAGKTTAVDVMLGLLSPEKGELLIDGVRIDQSNLRGWQNAIGYVPQQIFLVDDTVAANIAFGVAPERRNTGDVERAARLAMLHDFVVNELPQGYDTTVGERGVRLSGGQRQRIGIARALYHDPDVLILDEATSALDNLTERAVMDAVNNISHAKTIIMIAHRLSTVKGCDTIFFLENGRCAATGTYDELLAGNQAFRQMALASS